MSAGGWDDDHSTIHQHRFDPTPAPLVAFVLSVVEGPDQGRTFELDGSHPSRVIVGQSALCDFRLSDAEVSRRHAALELIGRALRLTDLGSSNGTVVDRLRINDVYLDGGELVRLGSTVLRVEREKAAKPRAPIPTATSFGRLFGASREMRRLYPLCDKLAAAEIPVIIEGETGTGKEILAECLHEAGPRAAGPFIVFDCTAVPPNLVESEIFGHEKGAFTGAVSTRKGVFEQAHGGTLLIDEIGDLESALQPKLLRVLERSAVRRVGGDRWIKVDVRVLSATRRDLEREVQAGRFRDDLFHRLAVARVELPPLRERRGDVALLARQFAHDLGGNAQSLPDELLARWEERAWPGNVRELRNAVARHLALGELSGMGDEEPKPSAPQNASTDVIDQVIAAKLPLIAARQRVVESFERRYIERILADHGGNVVQAAAASGIARRYFQILRAKRS